jgi:membrane protein
MSLAGLRAGTGRVMATGRRLLATVPFLQRLLRDLVRIELIDRSMAIAAQAMLALVPMLVVLVAFLPSGLTDLALDRFRDATGVGPEGSSVVRTNLDTDEVRAQTGLVGLLITLFSATAFARAVQRMYERVWERPHVGGLVGMRRSFVWLIGWLLTLQTLSAMGFLLGQVWDLGPAQLAVQSAMSCLIWWWTTRTLLFGRIAWSLLAPGALLTGISVTLYSWGSGLVMPVYVGASADQFGTLGLILAVTTWLVGFAGVLVVASVVGRVIAEDEDAVRLARRVGERLSVRRRPRREASTR